LGQLLLLLIFESTMTSGYPIPEHCVDRFEKECQLLFAEILVVKLPKRKVAHGGHFN